MFVLMCEFIGDVVCVVFGLFINLVVVCMWIDLVVCCVDVFV